MMGTMYTAKLAQHFFAKRVKQEGAMPDTCLVIQGSMAAYADVVGRASYMASKFGERGLMRGLRLQLWKYGTRVNFVAPWLVI